LQFDVERESIVEFRRGEDVAEIQDDSVKFVRGLGFERDFPELPPWQARVARDVIVVEGATVDELRSALGPGEAKVRWSTLKSVTLQQVQELLGVKSP
jgi:hypothetical protein